MIARRALVAKLSVAARRVDLALTHMYPGTRGHLVAPRSLQVTGMTGL